MNLKKLRVPCVSTEPAYKIPPNLVWELLRLQIARSYEFESNEGAVLEKHFSEVMKKVCPNFKKLGPKGSILKTTSATILKKFITWWFT